MADHLNDAQILHLWDTHVGEPTDKLPLTDDDKIGFARAVLYLASPPVAVQEEGDAKDGARYREFFASGLPITFLGVEYRTKAELDAAIDAVKGDQP